MQLTSAADTRHGAGRRGWEKGLDVFTCVNAWLSRLCMITAVIGLFGIVAVVIWQVFGRYVLNDTPVYAESVALLLVLVVTLLGAAAGVRDAGHVGMESLLILLPDRQRRWLEVVIHLLVLTFALTMSWYGSEMMMSVWDYTIPTLGGTPQGIQYVPVVVSGILIALFSIEHALAILAGREVIPSWH